MKGQGANSIMPWVILLGVASMLAAAMSIGLGSMRLTNAWSANANTSITNGDTGLLNLTAQFQTIWVGVKNIPLT